MVNLIDTTENSFIKNLTLSLYYYLKDNISSTVEGKIITTVYDIPQTTENLKDKLPIVVLSFNRISAGTDFAIGYGQIIKSFYTIWIYAGGDNTNNKNEKIRQLLISEIYNLFNRKESISFKEYPSQLEKGKIGTKASVTNISPTTDNIVEQFRAKVDIEAESILI